jgi:hypothetical protein
MGNAHNTRTTSLDNGDEAGNVNGATYRWPSNHQSRPTTINSEPDIGLPSQQAFVGFILQIRETISGDDEG